MPAIITFYVTVFQELTPYRSTLAGTIVAFGASNRWR
jgi:hypothetical protein